MRLFQDWEEAQSTLENLQEQLDECEQRLEHLLEASNPAELARTMRAGGAVFYNTGSLQSLQRTMLQKRVLSEAVRQQTEVVVSWEQRLEPHRLQWLRQRRDDVVAKMDRHVEELAELTATLHQIERESESLEVDTQEFDAEQRLHGILQKHAAPRTKQSDHEEAPISIRLPRAA